MSRLTKGYLSAILGVAFWSTTSILISILIGRYGMPALLLAGWRDLLVCAALIPVLFLINRPLLRVRAADLPFFMLYGLVLALFNAIFVLSVQTNGAAVATVLAYSSAGFTVIFAWLIFREPLGLAKLGAVGLSLFGIVLVSNVINIQIWSINRLGVVTGLLTGLLFSVYSLFGKAALRRGIDPWTSVVYSFGVATLFLFAFNLVPTFPGSAGTLRALFPILPQMGWLLLVILSCGPSLLGFGLYNTAMLYLPASVTNLIATAEPALTALGAYIFLHESLSSIQVTGSLLILGAVLLVQMRTRENQ